MGNNKNKRMLIRNDKMAINDNKVFWKRHIGNTRGHYVERDLKKKKGNRGHRDVEC